MPDAKAVNREAEVDALIHAPAGRCRGRTMALTVMIAAGVGASGCAGPSVQRPAPERGALQVADGRLAYEVAGAGPTVVLVHGGLVDARLWDEQVPALAAAHRVVRYDLRGYGRSTPPTGPFSHVDDLAALLDSLDVKDATLVGLSLGGSIAMDYALEHPARVRSLVLVGTGMQGFPFTPDPRAMRPFQLARTDPDGAVAFLMDSTPMAPTADPGRARMRRMLAENLAGWSGTDPRTIRWPQPPTIRRLEALRMPVLVLIAERDMPDLHRVADTLAARVAQARKVVLPGGSHHPNLDDPARFNTLLQGFLAEHVGAGAGAASAPR